MKVSFFFFEKKAVVKPVKCYKMHPRASKSQHFSGPLGEPPSVASQHFADHDRNPLTLFEKSLMYLWKLFLLPSSLTLTSTQNAGTWEIQPALLQI